MQLVIWFYASESFMITRLHTFRTKKTQRSYEINFEFGVFDYGNEESKSDLSQLIKLITLLLQCFWCKIWKMIYKLWLRGCVISFATCS